MFVSEYAWWVVAIAAVCNMVIGSFWYSPVLFGKWWAELTRMKEEEVGNMGMIYGVTFLCALLMNYIFGDIATLAHIETMGDGMLLGFWIWLGFVATSQLMGVIYAKKPLALYFIDTTYYLAVLVVVGGVFGLFS